jgi:hypothetical protein
MFAVRILHTSPGSEKIIQVAHHARDIIAKFEEEACQIIMILNAFQYQYIVRDEILYSIQMRYGVYVDTQSSTILQSSPPISRKINALLSANGFVRHINSCDVPHQVHPFFLFVYFPLISMPLHSESHQQNPLFYRL